ncbi:MAG TPA: response regulator [Kofleriaceae bacterium]|nr:response regulator [Kofleriaceae bacterium]
MGSILLVEADPETCGHWAADLGIAGHAVLTATAMRDALLTIREGGIDVVVIDAYDPRIGVIELAAALEALPDTPPLVLVSGSPAAPAISARICAAHFLAKPCEPFELVDVVTRLLGHRPVRVLDDDEPTGPVRFFH